MKTNYISLTLIMLFIVIITYAQQGINYKAIINDDNGGPIANSSITVQFTILENGTTTVFQETHNTTSDANGIIVVTISDGSILSGDFSTIDWGNSPHFLKTEIDKGDGLNDMGTTEFKAVPYALYAENGAGAQELNDLDDAKSNGYSVFVGQDAGAIETSTDNRSTAIGIRSLFSNTNGTANTASGYRALENNTTGSDNTANGFWVLGSNTEGSRNTAIGYEALLANTGSNNTATGYTALVANTTGYENTANGAGALYSNTTGYSNTAIGIRALYSNTTKSNLVAVGDSALYNNGKYAISPIHSIGNTAIGSKSLYSNATGYNNTANGYQALYSNTHGDYNTAIGVEVLHSNTTGNKNTASGYHALYSNTYGDYNTANGMEALYSNTEGDQNTAYGHEALGLNTRGSYNTAIGVSANYANRTGSRNTAIGYSALQSNTGNYNTAVGYSALYRGGIDNNIGIGNDAQVPNSTGSNQIRIGNEDITYAGIQVAWTITSDERWKEDIRSLPYGLDMLMKLKPVDYTRKNNEKKTREMGIIAQDLEEVLDEIGYEDQGLLIKDDDGLMHLRYNDFIALLIKSTQEQQAEIEEQQQMIEELQREIEQLKSNQDWL